MQRPLLAALLALSVTAPAHADQPAVDPWAGIAILDPAEAPAPVESASPYEDAVANAEAPAEDHDASDGTPMTITVSPPPQQGAPADSASPAAGEAGTSPDPGYVWSTLGGFVPPTPATEGPTPAEQVIKNAAGRSATTSAKRTLPTSLDLSHGPASVNVSTSVSANAPVSSALAASAGGASGEVKGRIDYALDSLVIYGTGNVGAAAGRSAVSLSDGSAIGSTYKVPLTPDGETLGMSAELANQSSVNTSVELRGPLGPFERFFSVEHARTIGTTGTETVKAGILGKF
ncbi:hypothetical protein [Ancylobacter lacus]|uniref:hypothetical protein n=1 Tax=Ancylobacter lacus TaxID=2579970 RepID=UPI001BCE6752|nr:hypothetical protein [Ancylobacter lacus]MBS7540609.1 hypothetical protein [Ancylobacter lacus]